MRQACSTVLLAGLACFFGFASGARAGVTIDLVFQDAPLPSGISISAGDPGPGCSFTGYYGGSATTGRCMDVILTTTEPFTKVSVSVGYESDNGLEFQQIYEWRGLVSYYFFKTGTPCRPVGGVADNGGILQSFDCTTQPPPSQPVWAGTYRLGTIIWDTSATTPGTEAIWAMFGPGDGMTAYINGNVVDISTSVVLGSHTLTIVPEPGTAALLGLSLVGLLIGARRRRAPAA